MADKESVARDAAGMLELGVSLGLLTAEQVESVSSLQKQMRRSGISLPVGQTLLERKYVTLTQLKDLRYELAQRTTAVQQTAAPAPVSEQPAKKFGQYEILKVLSEKDRARVFQARDTMMNRIVVLKVLPRSMTSDPQWAERFRREIILAGKLAHPNIATVYGAGEVDGNPLMTIEYIEGMSLGERLEREGNLPEKVAWRMAREVAKGLAFAASNGVVHRDIKPDNILCSNDGKIKIIDMGLSKSEGDVSGLTLEGTTVGTPFYISPEQARGTRDVDSRSDLYSLGCTVFHMLTGSVPFFHE
jgi:serine/threonine protein kinase